MQALAMEQQDDIQHWILHACYFNEVPSLTPQIQYRFLNRLTRVFGQAWYHKKLIEISIPLWHRATLQERRQLIIHETCHIVSMYKHGTHITAHGSEWKQCMIKCGVPAERCHHVNRDGLVRQYVKYEVQCDCALVWIGHVKAAQVRANRIKCRRCKGLARLTGNERRP